MSVASGVMEPCTGSGADARPGRPCPWSSTGPFCRTSGRDGPYGRDPLEQQSCPSPTRDLPILGAVASKRAVGPLATQRPPGQHRASQGGAAESKSVFLVRVLVHSVLTHQQLMNERYKARVCGPHLLQHLRHCEATTATHFPLTQWLAHTTPAIVLRHAVYSSTTTLP